MRRFPCWASNSHWISDTWLQSLPWIHVTPPYLTCSISRPFRARCSPSMCGRQLTTTKYTLLALYQVLYLAWTHARELSPILSLPIIHYVCVVINTLRKLYLFADTVPIISLLLIPAHKHFGCECSRNTYIYTYRSASLTMKHQPWQMRSHGIACGCELCHHSSFSQRVVEGIFIFAFSHLIALLANFYLYIYLQGICPSTCAFEDYCMLNEIFEISAGNTHICIFQDGELRTVV